MKERFVLREEKFGYTLFDKKLLRHKFLLPDEEISFEDTGVIENYEFLKAERLDEARRDIVYSPIRIYFDLTARCNLACRTCYNKSGKKKPDEISLEDAVKTIEGLRRDNVFDLRFSGGELTQRDDWHIILGKAKEEGFAVSMNTNGIYKDEEDVISKLIDLDLEQVTFSMDGWGALHDYIRGRGTHEKLVGVIKKLSKKGANLRINSIVTKEMYKDAEKILQFANEYVDEINFFPFRPIGRASEKLMDLCVSYDEMVRFDDYIDELKQKYRNVRILNREVVINNNMVGVEDYNHVGLYIGSTDGFTRFNLLQNGDMVAGGYASYIDKELILGNIIKEGYSVFDVWQKSEKLDKFRKFSQEVVKKCYSCEDYKTKCGGGFVELAIYNKVLGKPNPYCKYSVGDKNEKTDNLLRV